MSQNKGRISRGVQISPLQQIMSSSSGALVTALFVTPLDVVKIRLQAQKIPLVRGQHFLYCNGLMDHVCTCINGSISQWYKKSSHFSGTLDAFVKITRHEGITSLWSGLPPTLVMAMPATVIYFTCYEQLKALLKYSEFEKRDWWKPPIAGVLGRTWAVAVISPMEMVRTKMQSEQISYAFVGKAVKTSIQRDGILSMWRGLGPTLLRDVPFSAFYWCSYEQVKSHTMRTQGRTELKLFESFLAGAISGTVAAVLTLPFDVIKTHRQIELGQLKMCSFRDSREITSTWALILRLYKNQGLRSLYAGLVPRVIKVSPACAIMISSYEYSKNFFSALNEKKRI